MSQFLTFLGCEALSDFRRRQLADKIGCDEIWARYVHYVALNDRPSDLDQGALHELLLYGDHVVANEAEDDDENTTLFVYPRTSTISPWSSKATSIAKVCGFEQVDRIERGTMIKIRSKRDFDKDLATRALHDPMTQMISQFSPNLHHMFAQGTPAKLNVIDLYVEGMTPQAALGKANKEFGLALDKNEIEYLVKAYSGDGGLARSPTDVELMMFAQINSEHCRHKQFNASWTIDGFKKPHTLFSMIKETHQKNPRWVVSAYSDNAAVIESEGEIATFFAPEQKTGEWRQINEKVHYLV